MKILQIVPTIGPGTGVAAVAHHLEQEWRAAGVDVGQFTLDDAHGGWLPEPGPGVLGKLTLLARVVWFSTVGSVLARRRLAEEPGTVGVCHNDALAGDVYVNHGILRVAMASRGGYVWRMLRNPLHLFTALRDMWRYQHGTHRAVVNLTAEESRALAAVYPRMTTRAVVIGNGIDVERYRPPSAEERSAARRSLGLGPDDVALVFIGHEYDRKGLPLVLDALTLLPPQVRLVVVGGSTDMVAALDQRVRALGVGERVRAVGRRADPRPILHAADALVTPSAYESYGLVVLEALACGVPVIATPVGCVPDVVDDGGCGYVVEPTPAAIARAVHRLRDADRASLALAARATAERNSWGDVARSYLDLVTTMAAARAGDARPAPRRAR
ncbi:glycosyltransferase family 4 protein [Isoptericola halotolerans]|uniref:glycosyltransferase family 4 protein n=1 Tax=Isoptericola halotolerans TaxID=300560 RepID=UPI003890257F